MNKILKILKTFIFTIESVIMVTILIVPNVVLLLFMTGIVTLDHESVNREIVTLVDYLDNIEIYFK